MNDPDYIHRSLEAAFTARAESVSNAAPPFHEVEASGQQRSRRTLAAATLSLVAVGAVGLLAVASSDRNDPTESAAGDALPAPSDGQLFGPATTSYITWACSSPIGSSDDGSITYFQSCEQQPVPADGRSPFATTTTLASIPFCTPSVAVNETTIATDDVPCPEQTVEAPTTALVDRSSTITTVPCTPSGCGLVYELQTGDYPLLIAEAFCVTLDELIAANGWSDIGEFGFPGDVIQIPPSSTPCPTNVSIATTTTTTP
jgi:hypothetical protein